MASSNRHWPSLFKSKPCNNHPHHQWQHDINHSSPLSPGACQKPSYTSGLRSAEERSPEPKPRWNPKPEQIRILEAIFNSGMVNPPRDEIRRIRAQLQEYGQVGDANVFYWFQNRKSRSKHKQRHLQSTARHHHQSRAASAAPPAPPPPTHVPLAAAAATSSSSSSSERSTGSDKILPMVSVRFTGVIEAAAAASTTGSVRQNYLQGPAEFLVEPVYLQGGQGFCLSSAGELSGVVGVQEPGIGLVPGLWTELMTGREEVKGTTGGVEVSNIGAKMKNPNPNPNNNSGVVVAAGASGIAATTTAAATTSVETVAGPIHEIQGGVGVVGGGGAARSTVFINGMGFEVVAGFLNVWEVFGKEAVLIHASGLPVVTDDWGLTLHPLQDGASYYLI